MQTNFSAQQLADPATAVAESVIRKCVHCGFCTATCPTYLLLGDELDSPRGRIYLMKDMLENEREPTAAVVTHIDRCLSCLSCMTTCPSDVNYMHLIDHARAYVEQRYRRPWVERGIRAMLAAVLPYPRRFREALWLARLARPAAPFAARFQALQPLAAMLRMAPVHAAPRAAAAACASPGAVAAVATPALTARGRVVVLQGCAEPVLAPQIRAATLRLLARCGYEITVTASEGCCGALVHHLGRETQALQAARRNVDAWYPQIEQGLAAIVITTSGCGTTIKNYGFMLRDDPDYAARAAQVSALARDVSELLQAAGLPAVTTLHPHSQAQPQAQPLRVAWHAPCSMQHGQRIAQAPPQLLRAAGFEVLTPADAHLCCGSAGTYNLLQPAIAGQLGDRKAASLQRTGAALIATANIGCAMQIGQRSALPVVHVVELLDWATGGPTPAAIADAGYPAK